MAIRRSLNYGQADVAEKASYRSFDYRHGKNCISLQSTLPVRLNMIEPNNGQDPALTSERAKSNE